MKKISKKKNLLTKTGLGIVASSLVMTPIVTAIACGSDAKPTPIPEPINWSEIKPATELIDWSKIEPATLVNNFTGSFSTTAKEAEFMAITDTIPDGAFQNETLLESISLPQVVTVGENAFAMDNPDDGNQLTEINLPMVNEIKTNAFHNANVTKIDFPNVKKLGLSLFNQKTLTSISLASIEVIEDRTFTGVEKLTKLFLPKVITIGNNVFEELDEDFDELNFPLLENVGASVFWFSNVKKLIAPNLVNIELSAFAVADLQNMEGTLILSQAIKVGISAFKSALITTLKIPVLNINNVGDKAFESLQQNATITVEDKTLWENNARLAVIFGSNYSSITFVNA